MDETEDVRLGGIFCEGGYNSRVCGEVARRRTLEGARFDVEDVDEDTDRGEDMGLLSRKIGFGESILSSWVSCISPCWKRGGSYDKRTLRSPTN